MFRFWVSATATSFWHMPWAARWITIPKAVKPAPGRFACLLLHQANLPGAGFTAFGMVIHLAAHGMCQKLVAVADTQKRNIVFYCLAHPVGCLLAPGFPVTDHGRRAGDNDALPVRGVARR